MTDVKTVRQMVFVNGVKLLLRDTGSTRQPMLCLHGRWGRGETWTDLMLRYGDRYRILAPDQRGHGLSDKPHDGYSPRDMAADAFGLISQLDCGPAIVVGHSMGGRVAAYLAALYPQVVKALIILDSTAEAESVQVPAESITDEMLADDGLTSDWPISFATYDEARGFLAGKFERETNIRYFLDSLAESEDGYGFLFSRRATAAAGLQAGGWYDLLADIGCPVLLMRAAESWCLSREDADKMKELIGDCTCVEVANSDHMVYADNPDEFYQHFDQFLNRI